MDRGNRLLIVLFFALSFSFEVLCLTVLPSTNLSAFYAPSDSTAKLEWDLALESDETFVEASFYVELNIVSKIAELDSSGSSVLKNEDIPELFHDRVKAVKEDDHLALTITKVDDEFEKEYYCKVQSSKVTVQSTSLPLMLSVGPPTDVDAVSPDADSVKISWKAPKVTGVNFQGKYSVRFRLVGKDEWTSTRQTFKALSYTVTGLEESEEYEFRVRAWDDAGAGPEVSRRVKTGGDSGLSTASIGLIVGLVLLVIIIIALVVLVVKAKKGKGKKDEKTVRMNGSPSAAAPPKADTYYDEVDEKKQPRNTYNTYPPRERDRDVVDETDYPDQPPRYNDRPPTLSRSQEYIGPTYALV